MQYLRKAAERMGEWDIDYVCKFLDHINCGQHKDVSIFTLCSANFFKYK